jgi:hypothetical protein
MGLAWPLLPAMGIWDTPIAFTIRSIAKGADRQPAASQSEIGGDAFVAISPD